LQGEQAQQVDFQARVCSNFVEKIRFSSVGLLYFFEKRRSATTGCANNAERIIGLYRIW
jgi:hypothetical protein